MKTKNLVQNIYKMTPLQQGMLFHTMYEDRSAYLAQHYFGLAGELEIRYFERSLNEVIERYDILRTIFRKNKTDQYVQIVLRERKLKVYFNDLSRMDKQEQDEIWNAYRRSDRETGFDLTKDLLMRVAVFQTGPSRFEVLWSHHHILMDGWCLSTIISETMQLYQSFVKGAEAVLDPVIPYSQYIKWLDGQDERVAAEYWKSYLSEYDEQVFIVKEDYSGKKGETKKSVFTLSRQDTRSLQELARYHNVTLNVLIQCLWGVLLQKYNGVRDVVFGTVVSGRPPQIKGIESMVGLFINTIPVRISCEPSESFVELLTKVQQASTEANKYDYYPLYEIQALSSIKQGLINNIVVFENYPVTKEIENAAADVSALSIIDANV
ncbi:non-ribosomal peptide synthetase, partial [Paenibacillus oenotherae]